jgi:hypothetical protein
MSDRYMEKMYEGTNLSLSGVMLFRELRRAYQAGVHDERANSGIDEVLVSLYKMVGILDVYVFIRKEDGEKTAREAVSQSIDKILTEGKNILQAHNMPYKQPKGMEGADD